MTFSEKLKNLRIAKGYTQVAFSNELGISKDLYNKYERAGIRPQYEVLIKMADLLETTVDYLIVDTKPTLDSEESILKKIGAMPANGLYKIPLLGRVVAGEPLCAEENFEGYIYTDYSPAEDYFALRVFGDSMINDGIIDGSIVIVKKQSTAHNGDTAVVLINGDEATVKKYKITPDGHHILMPANDKYSPIILTPELDAQILGIVVEVRTKR